MRQTLIVLAALVLMGGTPAAAEDGGVTAEEMAAALKNAGYPAEISKDRSGDPLIKSTSGTAKFGVFFYQCGGQLRCKSVQFSAGFSQKGVKAAKLADWNRNRRFGRAYQDNVADPWVEMDIDAARGLPAEVLESNVDRWIAVLSEFQRFITR